MLLRTVLMFAVVAACRRSAAPVDGPLKHEDPATLIAPEIDSVVRTSGAESPILMYTRQLYRSQCSDDLIADLHDGWTLGAIGRPNVFMFQGNVPRDRFEKCLAHAQQFQLSHDGDFLVFELMGQKAYVAWRGDVIVAGTKEAVTSALAPHDAALAKTWHDRLARLPAAKMAMWSQQPLVSLFLGVPTRSFTFAVDTDGKMPPATYSFRIDAEYRDPADAAAAQKQLATGEVPPGVDPPPAIAAGLAHAHATVTGSHLAIELDQQTFAGVDFATLQGWALDVAKHFNAR